MASTLFTGITNHNQINSYNTSTIPAGSTRWNTNTNAFEAFNGSNWVQMTDGTNETLQDIVQHAEDRIAVTIESEYKDNLTIQDAYKVWEEANERFKIILALTEKK